jgi:transcriptional regulator with XRE-family HTH domain
MTNVDFGVRVQKAREARGLKASDLARLVGVTPTAVWNWENKGRRPHADTLFSFG